MTFQLSIWQPFLPACPIPGDRLLSAFVHLDNMARRYSVPQTLEPRWTLQGAPVGRPFVSSKSDLAHIAGSVSQSMHQTSNTRGLPRRINESTRLTATLASPQPFTQRQLQVCHSGVLWPLQSASCLCANCGMNHTLVMEWGGSGPATTPRLHAAAAALSRPLIRRLHTIRLQIICGLS